MNVENWTFLRLHKNYEISSIIVLRRKLSQQYVKFFKIFQKINNLAYKLNISHEWKIWSVIFIAQFEFSSASNTNSFKKIRDSSSSISMKDDLKSNNVKSFEVEKIIVKRLNRKKESEYLIRWLKYKSQNDFWRNFQKLRSVMKLIKEFDDVNTVASAVSEIVFRSRERLKKNNLQHWQNRQWLFFCEQLLHQYSIKLLITNRYAYRRVVTLIGMTTERSIYASALEDIALALYLAEYYGRYTLDSINRGHGPF